jgi:hypothetical protein
MPWAQFVAYAPTGLDVDHLNMITGNLDPIWRSG